MPPEGSSKSMKPLQEIVDLVGLYPIDAYAFVQHGLTRSVQTVHGPATPTAEDAEEEDDESTAPSRHITGRDLCLGLRDEAWERWGLLARMVLARWNVTSTMDFGRIVFALVEHQHLQKTDEDTLDDFRGVYDFRTAMEADYRVAPGVDGGEKPKPKRAGKKST